MLLVRFAPGKPLALALRSWRSLSTSLLLIVWGAVLAQGQDGTPGQRNLQIMNELLVGTYDNANQHYFDGRLELADELRHERLHLVVERADESTPAKPVFSFVLKNTDNKEDTRGSLSLAEDDDPRLVGMHIKSDDERLKDCNLLWQREAGQFTAEAACGLRMQLTPQAIWFAWDGKKPAYELSRARQFGCYVDIPGVSGGRDEPFERYTIARIHDQGGHEWVREKGGREVGITLRNVRWPMNNEQTAFTRNSLVLYVSERTHTGIRELSYGWTEPRAERIGLNLKWLLVNCYRVSNRDVRPFFE